MYIGTVRVELPNGQWWDIKAELTRGDCKRIEQLKRQWYIWDDSVDAEVLKENPSRGLRVDYSKMDLVALDDLVLEVGSVSWSFPEPMRIDGGFNRRFVEEELPKSYAEIVLRRMNELYANETEREKVTAQKKA